MRRIPYLRIITRISSVVLAVAVTAAPKKW
jgi:hypothetical protein